MGLLFLNKIKGCTGYKSSVYIINIAEECSPNDTMICI